MSNLNSTTKKAWVLISTLLLVCSAYSQQNFQNLPFLSEAGSSIPPNFDKNAVQFVFIKTSDTNYVPDGTCFSVNVKSYHIPKFFIPLPFVGRPTLSYSVRYFITAKHVLYDESGNLRPNMYIRVGTQKGGLDYLSLSSEINNGNFRVLTPTNNDVDIAILAGRVPTTNEIAKATQSNPTDMTSGLKLGTIKSSIVVDKSSFNLNGIREGSEMFFVGLFTPFYGANDNFPIYRFGHLAMRPDEPIPMGNQGRRDLMLMETGAYPGNSGSPAFFLVKRPLIPAALYQLVTGDGSGNKIILAGVVDAYFPDYSDLKIVNASPRIMSSSNTGIAAIVPASYIYDILFSKQEKANRKAQFKLFRPHGYF